MLLREFFLKEVNLNIDVGKSLWAKSGRGSQKTPEVVEIQKWLNANGFNAGKPDGIYGKTTANAIRAFQKAKGIAVDGDVGPGTLKAMQSAGASQQPTQEPQQQPAQEPQQQPAQEPQQQVSQEPQQQPAQEPQQQVSQEPQQQVSQEPQQPTQEPQQQVSQEPQQQPTQEPQQQPQQQVSQEPQQPAQEPQDAGPSGLDATFNVNGKEMSGNDIAGRLNDLLDKIGLGGTDESVSYKSRIAKVISEQLSDAEKKELQTLLNVVKGDAFFTGFLDPIATRLQDAGLDYKAGSYKPAPQTKKQKSKKQNDFKGVFKTDNEKGDSFKGMFSTDDADGEGASTTQTSTRDGNTTTTSTKNVTRKVSGGTTKSGGGTITRTSAKYDYNDKGKELLAQAKQIRKDARAYAKKWHQENPGRKKMDHVRDPGYKKLKDQARQLELQAEKEKVEVEPATVTTTKGY